MRLEAFAPHMPARHREPLRRGGRGIMKVSCVLSVVRCYSFATDYRPLTTDKCYSPASLRDGLPAILSSVAPFTREGSFDYEVEWISS